MISDVLAQAIEDIDEYLVSFPETYCAFQARIAGVRAAMDQLRADLDLSPQGIGPEWTCDLCGQVDSALRVNPGSLSQSGAAAGKRICLRCLRAAIEGL